MWEELALLLLLLVLLLLQLLVEVFCCFISGGSSAFAARISEAIVHRPSSLSDVSVSPELDSVESR